VRVLRGYALYEFRTVGECSVRKVSLWVKGGPDNPVRRVQVGGETKLKTYTKENIAAARETMSASRPLSP
jgi:hypothetical protein